MIAFAGRVGSQSFLLATGPDPVGYCPRPTKSDHIYSPDTANSPPLSATVRYLQLRRVWAPRGSLWSWVRRLHRVVSTSPVPAKSARTFSENRSEEQRNRGKGPRAPIPIESILLTTKAVAVATVEFPQGTRGFQSGTDRRDHHLLLPPNPRLCVIA